MLQLTFNPGLTLTSFRTTRSRAFWKRCRHDDRVISLPEFSSNTNKISPARLWAFDARVKTPFSNFSRVMWTGLKSRNWVPVLLLYTNLLVFEIFSSKVIVNAVNFGKCSEAFFGNLQKIDRKLRKIVIKVVVILQGCLKLWNFSSRVQLYISLVSCAHSWDIDLNLEDKFHICERPCLNPRLSNSNES